MAEALSTALLPHISRIDALKHVERLSRIADREGHSLTEIATADPEVSQWLSASDLDRVLAPENFLGSAPLFVERVLTQWAM